jgi:two-component system, sensor histidine kinase YesM
VEEELYKYSTMKLILQPIVENSIYHGIKEKRGLGHIEVRGRDLGDVIVFEVLDNGKGMSKDKLNALRNALNNGVQDKMEVYGVKNVNERLKIFFGAEYGLTFFSEEDVGTRVEIRIPKLLEVEANAESNLG